MEMAQRNKLNRKACARLCRAFFWPAIFLAQIWRSNRFAGSNQHGRAARWSSRELWRKLLQAAVSFTRLLGNGRLGSPKWNKQTSLVNTCRRIVSQICLFFYLGVYITCTSLNSNQESLLIVTLEEKNARWTWSRIYLTSEYYVIITQPTVSKRKTSHAVSNTVKNRPSN